MKAVVVVKLVKMKCRMWGGGVLKYIKIWGKEEIYIIGSSNLM